MLVELKRRLREISDLTAAGDILTWDQATYMPRGGADARARQCAAVYGLAHEQAVAPALGKLLDALAHYGERLPRDSDDASLIRVARRDFQKMIKIPPDHVTRANAHGSASYNHGPGSAGERLCGHGALSRTHARPQPGIFILLCALQARG
jgi:carboxypeptidase Taq